MSEQSKRIGEQTGSTLKRLGRALGNLLGGARPEPAEERYIATLFLLFGHLARADGHVSQQEAELGEQLITRLDLNRHGRKLAVHQFERGKQGGFNLQAELQAFTAIHPPRSARALGLLDVLIELARADGRLRPAERGLLEKIATGLGVNPLDLKRRLDEGQPLPVIPPLTASRSALLERAYALLGIAAEASDDDVRQAYRRLLSRLHPDKLAGQGLSPKVLQGAQERTQEVRGAYETVRAARGMR